MPDHPLKPCCHPGCKELVRGVARCETHAKARKKEVDARRPNATDRGYGSRWRRARERFLRANPLCIKCLDDGLVVAANVVDHVIDHKGNQQIFWDEGNWQALCKVCHDRKTAETVWHGGSN